DPVVHTAVSPGTRKNMAVRRSVSVEERHGGTFLVAFGFEVCAKVRDRNTVLFAFFAVADRHRSGLLFGIAHDQHIGQAVVVTRPDLTAHGPRARFDFGSELIEFGSYRPGILDIVVADRKDSDLFGREPEREIAAKVLDE